MKKTLTDAQQKTIEEIDQIFNIETIPDAFIALDRSSHIIIWNKGAEKLYGYRRDEALGKKADSIIKARPLNATIDEVKKYIKDNRHWFGEVIQYHKSGRRLFISGSVVVIKNNKGEVIGTITFNRDITHHKQVEYNLRFLSASAKALGSSLNYQTTLNKVTQLAVPRIADWCAIELINDNNELERVAIAHRDPKKVKWAQELRKRNPPNLNDTTGIAKVIRTGKSEFYPYLSEEVLKVTAKDEKRFELLKKLKITAGIIVPITSGYNHKPIGAITMISAESGRHYTQSDLQTAEKLAAQASFAIENSRLYQNAEREIEERKHIEERLREMESKKDNFISMASHELKTPITSLKIYTDMLEKQLKKEHSTQFDKTLTNMHSQISKLNLLIVDLLNLSKIQAGNLELRMSTFDLDALIVEIVEQLQPTTDHKIVVKNKALSQAFGDRDRIGQVLINLLTNAIKYSPEDEEVIISVKPDKMGVIVSVRDFGVGIDKEHRKKIFERFYQIESENKTYPGLGMGLYISQEIVNRHGGILWVDKAPGKGSLFQFTIPRHNKNHEKENPHY